MSNYLIPATQPPAHPSNRHHYDSSDSEMEDTRLVATGVRYAYEGNQKVKKIRDDKILFLNA